MRRWMLWAALAFAVFFVATAGPEGRAVAAEFSRFGVELLKAVGEFLGGLLDGCRGMGRAEQPRALSPAPCRVYRGWGTPGSLGDGLLVATPSVVACSGEWW